MYTAYGIVTLKLWKEFRVKFRFNEFWTSKFNAGKTFEETLGIYSL